MGKRHLLLFVAMVATAAAQQPPSALVYVQGGSFRDVRSNYFGKTLIRDSYVGRRVGVPDFYIGRHEVTQKEWTEVMDANPSHFKGDNLPVDSVSWYDCVEYCNRRSLKEGLRPCYTINRAARDPANTNPIDPLKWTVTINAGANGYRLPTEAEWEYAATGGQKSRDFAYCGNNAVDAVGWYFANSGDRPLHGYWSWPVIEHNHNRTHPVGSKAPNELGLYDMSGNVREWCWNWYSDTPSNDTGPVASAAGRVWRGGGWMGGDFCCAPSYRAGFEASGTGADQGFRVCRDAGDNVAVHNPPQPPAGGASPRNRS